MWEWVECVELEFAFHLATHNCADAVCLHIDSGDLLRIDDHDRMVRVGIVPGAARTFPPKRLGVACLMIETIDSKLGVVY